MTGVGADDSGDAGGAQHATPPGYEAGNRTRSGGSSLSPDLSEPDRPERSAAPSTSKPGLGWLGTKAVLLRGLLLVLVLAIFGGVLLYAYLSGQPRQVESVRMLSPVRTLTMGETAMIRVAGRSGEFEFEATVTVRNMRESASPPSYLGNSLRPGNVWVVAEASVHLLSGSMQLVNPFKLAAGGGAVFLSLDETSLSPPPGFGPYFPTPVLGLAAGETATANIVFFDVPPGRRTVTFGSLPGGRWVHTSAP